MMSNTTYTRYLLVLDDDPYILEFIKELSRAASTECFATKTLEEAVLVLQEKGSDHCALAIVDLFLDGDRGELLSQKFIEEYVIPENVPYCRFTSAPNLVPPHLTGFGVFDKRKILSNPDEFFNFILTYK